MATVREEAQNWVNPKTGKGYTLKEELANPSFQKPGESLADYQSRAAKNAFIGTMDYSGESIDKQLQFQDIYKQQEKMFSDKNAASNRANFANALTNLQNQQIMQTMDPSLLGQQMSYIQQLQNQASGNAPSITNLQMQQAGQQSLAQQLAMANSSRNPLAARNAAVNQASTMGNLGSQAMVQRLAEQQAAQNQLQTALKTGIDTQQATNAANLNAAVQQQTSKNQLLPTYLQQVSQYDASQIAQKYQMLQNLIQQKMVEQGAMNQVSAQNTSSWMNMFGGILNAAGSVGAALA